MKVREVGNAALHVGVGAALTALVCWNLWFMVLATFLFATLREQAQHRYIINLHQQFSMTPDFPVHKVTKRTFWDWSWLKWHHVFEIAQWVVGSVLGVLAVECFVHRHTVGLAIINAIG